MAAPAWAQQVTFVRAGVVLENVPPGMAELGIDGVRRAIVPIGDPGTGLVLFAWTPGQSLRVGSGSRAGQVTAPERPTPWRLWAHDWGGTGPGITALAFSPAGALLAAGDAAGQVTVFETATGRVRWRLLRPGRVIRQLAFGAEDRLYIGEQGAEGRLGAYDLTPDGMKRRWVWDTAAELGGQPSQSAGDLAWVSRPGVYRLMAGGGGVLAAFSHSWLDGGQRRARARLYRLDGDTGRPMWGYPPSGPARRILTWFATDAASGRVALPLQRPYGDRPGPGEAADSRIVVLDGDTGRPRFDETVPAAEGQPFAAFWRGVGLSPDGRHLALATEDGRGLIYERRGGEFRSRQTLELARPIAIAGTVILATNGALLATAAGPVFATGQTYVPAQAPNPERPPVVRHPRGNALLAYDWAGNPRWAWPLDADLMGLAWDREHDLLAVAQGSESTAPVQLTQGLALLRLSQPGSGAEKLRYRFPVAGQTVFGGVAVSPDGRWIALAEAPRVSAGSGRSQGAHRLHLLH